MSTSSHAKRRRFTPIALATGAAAALILSLSLTGTLSGFVASITNSQNTAGTGALIMQEQNSSGTVTCLSTDGGSISTNTSTCSTINKFGGNQAMVPGTAVVTPITIKNVGTVSAATFTLKAGSNCTQTNNGSANGSATDLCAKLAVVITSGGTTIFNGTAASLAATSATPIAIPAPLVPVAAGTTIPISVSVTLDPAAGANYQGLAASLPLTWTFVS